VWYGWKNRQKDQCNRTESPEIDLHKYSQLSSIAGGNAKWYRNFWWFLTKLNIALPYNPAVMLLGVYPNEMKTSVHTRNCTWMFIAALVIIMQNLKQSRCPLICKWINKLCCIYTMEYFSDQRKWTIKSQKDLKGS